MNKINSSEINTTEVYPLGVQAQINNFLQYRDGKRMVKRYLAILNSPDYLERLPNRRKTQPNRKKLFS